MDKSLICFLPFSDTGSVTASIASLRSSGLVSKVFVVLPPGSKGFPDGADAGLITSEGFAATDALRKMAATAVDSDYVLTYSKGFPLDMGNHALARMKQVCGDTGAGMVYSDYYEKKGDAIAPHPVIDYQNLYTHHQQKEHSFEVHLTQLNHLQIDQKY